jgi:DNA-binding NarL/FixJ family response regulator
MSLGAVAISTQALKPVPLPSARRRALVVDDSETILHAICSLLEHHDVVEVAGRAESGTQTLDAILELKPDLVLMDADMPGMSGLRAALLLSQIAPTTEIILMSMDTSAQFRAACAGCGARAVIYKPRFLRELSVLLERPLRAGSVPGQR